MLKAMNSPPRTGQSKMNSLSKNATKPKTLTPEERLRRLKELRAKALQAKLRKEHKKNPASGQGVFGDGTPHWQSAVAKAQKWRNKYSQPDEIPDSMVPSEWDFRNIGGYDFTGKVRDQLECGSCYTLGFIQAVEARMNLKYA